MSNSTDNSDPTTSDNPHKIAISLEHDDGINTPVRVIVIGGGDPVYSRHATQLFSVLKQHDIHATILDPSDAPANTFVLGTGGPGPLPSTRDMIRSLNDLILQIPSDDYAFALPQSEVRTNTPWFQAYDKKAHGRFNKHHAKKRTR